MWSWRLGKKRASASGAASAAAASALGEAKWIVGPVSVDNLLQALVQSAATAPGTTFVVFASRYQLRPLDTPALRQKKAGLPVVSPVGSPRSAPGAGVLPEPTVQAAGDGGSSTGRDASCPCCYTYGFAEMTPETRKFYDDLLAQREQHADVEQAETEQIWTLGANLRVVWGGAQRSDKDLNGYFRKGATYPHDVRIAEDGVLEHLSPDRSPEKPEWVPIVPSGYATSHLTWKQWVFLQMHIGIFGHHRAGKKTYQLMKDVVWWSTMKTDVFTWYDECLTCLRFRKRPTRQDQVAVKPTSLHPWQEIMIDCEGSSRPPDAAGNTYVLSYFCCLTHGVLLEPMRSLTHSEVRRAFSRALFRSGTIPKLLRSDRGPEFKNTLMAEFVALVGLRHRFGAPWRPNEQSGVERVHQEVQKVLGMLIQDVLQAEPSYWTEVLPTVEFVIYNTPGPHGYTPRDIDRRWSLGAPLEHDLEPFEVMDFEPLSDHVRNILSLIHI